ncbi:hypothetical protein L484_014838 [Morus notabilis]|uniref:Uncharacterized protein n=1 Tax=Morus notabilis TaxID=981085 RepID=W9R0E6_9ROSA|nr:hypothetical protein L484_014838 [Morus notabilis]
MAARSAGTSGRRAARSPNFFGLGRAGPISARPSKKFGFGLGQPGFDMSTLARRRRKELSKNSSFYSFTVGKKL